MNLLQIPDIQNQILTWEKEIPTEQEKHWLMQTRGHFDMKLYKRVVEAKKRKEGKNV